MLRNMASIYLTDGGRILMLERVGSRVVADRAWIGTAGGHFEQGELNDPLRCVLRELREETGLYAPDIEGARLRYITLRRVGSEIRQNYYFFAALRQPGRAVQSNEGRLRWFSFEAAQELDMPFTARSCLAHYFSG